MSKDLSGDALVAGFAPSAVAPERPDDWETPLPKRQRAETGETYTVRVIQGDTEVYNDKARHPGETMAMVEMLGKLDKAAWDKAEAYAEVRDGDHVMYCGLVDSTQGFAVLHGVPKRAK